MSSAITQIEFGSTGCEPSITSRGAALLDSQDSPSETPLVPPQLVGVIVWQSTSDAASFDRFIGRMLSTVPDVKLVSRERIGEKFRFYVVVDDSDAKAIEKVFDKEREIYSRFAD